MIDPVHNIPETAGGRQGWTMTLPNLNAWRLYRMLSNKRLGERAGMSPSTVSRASRGHATIFPNVERLAAALGITVQQLVNEEPPHGVIEPLPNSLNSPNTPYGN